MAIRYLSDIDLSQNSLKNVKIPGNYIQLQNRAFLNCSSLALFVWDASEAIYENQSLEYEVFSNCSDLRDVYFSKNIGAIGKNIFSGCNNILIHTSSDSVVESYAENNGIEYVIE